MESRGAREKISAIVTALVLTVVLSYYFPLSSYTIAIQRVFTDTPAALPASPNTFVIPTERVGYDGDYAMHAPYANITFVCLENTTECEMRGALAPYPDSYKIKCYVPQVPATCSATVTYQSRISLVYAVIAIVVVGFAALLGAAGILYVLESLETWRLGDFLKKACNGQSDSMILQKSMVLRFDENRLTIQSPDLKTTLICNGKRVGTPQSHPQPSKDTDPILFKYSLDTIAESADKHNVWLAYSKDIYFMFTAHMLKIWINGTITEFVRVPVTTT